MKPVRDARRELFEASFTDSHRYVARFADTGDTEILFSLHAAPPVLQTSVLEGKRSVAMQSGLGDGTYVVYGGYAADGALTRLLVDFDLFG